MTPLSVSNCVGESLLEAVSRQETERLRLYSTHLLQYHGELEDFEQEQEKFFKESDTQPEECSRNLSQEVATRKWEEEHGIGGKADSSSTTIG